MDGLEILSAFTQHARQVLWRTLSELICASLSSASPYPLLSSPPFFLSLRPFAHVRRKVGRKAASKLVQITVHWSLVHLLLGVSRKKREIQNFFFPFGLLWIRSRDLWIVKEFSGLLDVQAFSWIFFKADLEEIPLIYSFNDRSKLLHGLKKLLEICSSIAASNQFVMQGSSISVNSTTLKSSLINLPIPRTLIERASNPPAS